MDRRGYVTTRSRRFSRFGNNDNDTSGDMNQRKMFDHDALLTFSDRKTSITKNNSEETDNNNIIKEQLVNQVSSDIILSKIDNLTSAIEDLRESTVKNQDNQSMTVDKLDKLENSMREQKQTCDDEPLLDVSSMVIDFLDKLSKSEWFPLDEQIKYKKFLYSARGDKFKTQTFSAVFTDDETTATVDGYLENELYSASGSLDLALFLPLYFLPLGDSNENYKFYGNDQIKVYVSDVDYITYIRDSEDEVKYTFSYAKLKGKYIEDITLLDLTDVTIHVSSILVESLQSQ